MKSKANVREIRLRIGSEVMAMQWNGMREEWAEDYNQL